MNKIRLCPNCKRRPLDPHLRPESWCVWCYKEHAHDDPHSPETQAWFKQMNTGAN